MRRIHTHVGHVFPLFPSFFISYLTSGFAYFCVHSRAVSMAAFSSSFQALATSAARGSSGFGAPRRAWMERRMVRIWRAGDQLSKDNIVSHQRQRTTIYMKVDDKKQKRTFQDVKADATQLVDVGVEDLGQEADLGGHHWVVVGEEELELEVTACCCRRAKQDPWLVIYPSQTCVWFSFSREKESEPSYGEEPGPSIVTSKYRRFSACGTALIPGTLALVSRGAFLSFWALDWSCGGGG